jgi:hypothetical protein
MKSKPPPDPVPSPQVADVHAGLCRDVVLGPIAEKATPLPTFPPAATSTVVPRVLVLRRA